MTKKNTNVRSVKSLDELRRTSEGLRRKGFEPYNAFTLPGKNVKADDLPERTWSDMIHSALRSGTKETGSAQRREVPTLYFSSGNEVATDEGIGTKDLGFMEWGFGNRLPNVVSILTQMLPYTATGAKFLSDMLAGFGPQPMYEVTQYVGGNLTTKTIRYKDAGTYLMGRITDKQRELYNLAVGHSLDAPSDETVNSAFDSIRLRLEEEIKLLEGNLEKWKATNPEVEKFVERNNLSYTWLSMVIDQVMFGICFPEIHLNQQDLDKDGKPVKTNVWTPKVVGFSSQSCHTTRLERMDERGIINYVYTSNRWLDSAFVDSQDASRPNAIHALDMRVPVPALRRHVREARQMNVSVDERPTRFVLPSVYPTSGRPYYPTPPWHSVFGGDIYEYISTIISDRFTRKKNSSIIGRVIYLNTEYLRQMSLQADAEGNTETIDVLRDKFFKEVNTWLSNRDNAGQSLLAFTFQGTDGKEHKSFEVVEIENTNKSSVEANEKETAELSSIIFMALGLDARLMGSSPLSLVGSNGGTDLRERFLLRQILQSPTLNLLLKPFEVLSRFNEWDSHLVWEVKREVMTTLDRSKTGVTEAETN